VVLELGRGHAEARFADFRAGQRDPPRCRRHPPCVAQCALGLQASVDASRYTIVICAVFGLLSAPPAGGYAPLVFSIVARFCMAVFCGNAAACRLAFDACDALAIGGRMTFNLDGLLDAYHFGGGEGTLKKWVALAFTGVG
jgi:hypothetical protein